MRDENSFSVDDASINVSTVVRDDWPVYHALRDVLRKAGFTFHQDPHIRKRYRCLAKTHHAGSRRDVHFISQIYPIGFNFEFYEDVVRDNRNGGRYHFDKMRKMPYLRRLAVVAAHRKIIACLEGLGYVDKSYQAPQDSMKCILARRLEIEEFHGKDFYSKGVASYNSKESDGVHLKDGDLRYFRSYSGHLCRGRVYHNLNNMWWVAVDPFCAQNIASFELFSYEAARHPRKKHPYPKRRLQTALNKAVSRQDFERAIGMRDALRVQELPA